MPVTDTQTAPQDLDGKTFAEVKRSVLAGETVRRDFRTGHIVPAHMQGTMYSPRDLFASALAEAEAGLKAYYARAQRSADPVKLAAE